MIPAPAFTPRTNDRVGAAIAQASARTGVDFDYLIGQARLESGFNPNARARTSSATGLYQFIDSTWLGVVAQHGAAHGLGWAAAAIERGSDGRYRVADPAMRRAIMDLRRQPEAAAAMAGEFAADNARHLETRLGRAAEPVDLYLAHFLGAGGAARFLARHDSEPGAAAAPEFARQARANPSIFYDRSGAPRSFAEIRSLFERRLGVSGDGAATMMAAPRRAPDNIGTYAEMQAALRTHSAVTPGVTQTVTPDGGRDAAIVQARLAYLMLAQLGA